MYLFISKQNLSSYDEGMSMLFRPHNIGTTFVHMDPEYRQDNQHKIGILLQDPT